MWIHVARIPVLTPELVYILMMDLFVIVQWGLRERTVKVCTFFSDDSIMHKINRYANILKNSDYLINL